MEAVFLLDTLGNLRDPDLCVIDLTPDDIGVKYSRLIRGRLILHRDAKEVIAADHARRGGRGSIEYLPFTLLDQKGRPHSSDYFFVNPIGAVDCVDHAKSDITYFEGDLTKVLRIQRLVLDPAKLADAPPVFRVPQALDRYFVLSELKEKLSQGFTNLIFNEIQLAA
jgi:hypothetical protein